MSNNKLLKELLKNCVRTIDDWDLVNGAQDPDSLSDLIKLLATSAHVVGIDPNTLKSLQAVLKDGKYVITITPPKGSDD